MGTPYIGEIRLGGWNFAPVGWAMCNGQLMSIDENPALFTLIGTTYGGDGVTSFGLPDLRGRVPVHQASDFPIGQAAGSETVTLTSSQLPAHPHSFMCSTDSATQRSPAGNVPATLPTGSAYIQATPTAVMAPAIPASGGGGQSHSNLQPYQCVTYIIALTGMYPPHS